MGGKRMLAWIVWRGWHRLLDGPALIIRIGYTHFTGVEERDVDYACFLLPQDPQPISASDTRAVPIHRGAVEMAKQATEALSCGRFKRTILRREPYERAAGASWDEFRLAMTINDHNVSNGYLTTNELTRPLSNVTQVGARLSGGAACDCENYYAD